jgi:hypothetical protein
MIEKYVFGTRHLNKCSYYVRPYVLYGGLKNEGSVFELRFLDSAVQTKRLEREREEYFIGTCYSMGNKETIDIGWRVKCPTNFV